MTPDANLIFDSYWLEKKHDCACVKLWQS